MTPEELLYKSIKNSQRKLKYLEERKEWVEARKLKYLEELMEARKAEAEKEARVVYSPRPRGDPILLDASNARLKELRREYARSGYRVVDNRPLWMKQQEREVERLEQKEERAERAFYRKNRLPMPSYLRSSNPAPRQQRARAPAGRRR